MSFYMRKCVREKSTHAPHPTHIYFIFKLKKKYKCEGDGESEKKSKIKKKHFQKEITAKLFIHSYLWNQIESKTSPVLIYYKCITKDCGNLYKLIFDKTFYTFKLQQTLLKHFMS